ncbi:glycosyltransferase family 2 protein [Halomarina ordinaria]|uniref:Glycosyltransferase family 2 protein n=1 Tax=Halomarina ordinaria TaxID=3033939 RepID=A0ABD5UD26_9EURY|nr:glycosyltransferase family 2 protein [Halomarina sp. PSRA2]
MSPRTDGPLVSVVVPTYNRSGAVTGAVESALDQTYSNLEVVVVDDGSTDDTRAVLDDYAADRERVRVVHSATNEGIPAARNRGLAAARGEYVCPLDDDDRWHPAKVERQVAALDSLDDDYWGVYTHGRIVDREGRLEARVESDAAGDVYPDVLVEMSILPHSGHMARATCLEAVGGYDDGFDVACDWDLTVRLCRRWKVALLPEVLVERTHGGDNVTGDPGYDVRARALVAEKFEGAIEETGVARAFAAASARERGLLALDRGERWEATRRFAAAFRAAPTPDHLALAALAPLGPRGLAVARRVRSLLAR